MGCRLLHTAPTAMQVPPLNDTFVVTQQLPSVHCAPGQHGFPATPHLRQALLPVSEL
jgi:hypothetical protein